MEIADIVAEFKRRLVFRVLVGYGACTFAILQIVEPIIHALRLSDQVLTWTVVFLAVGLPFAIAMGLVWISVRGNRYETRLKQVACSRSVVRHSSSHWV